MGRLTRRAESDEAKAVYLYENTTDDTKCFLDGEYGYKAFDKLAAYEDIIDDPEKLKLIDALYLERCEEINELNKELAEEYNQGWIPCNERLPEKHGHYLVCSKDVIWVADYYNYTWWGVEKRCRWGDIEAWQPLPEPYKECEVKQGLYKLSQEPKTRIEHIRSMSVGELADAILERSEISTAIDYCQNFEECHEDVPEDECRKCLIQYLNSPVER